MKNSIKHYITINNKKLSYTIKGIDKNTAFIECEAANIAQTFLKEDIPDLLNDLPNLVLAEKNHKKHQDEVIRFRVSTEDKKIIEKKALKEGYVSISSFLRDLALGHS
jgi:hypothetical protein